MGSTIAITSATVIDGLGGPPRHDATVLVRDGRFVAVGADRSIAIPEDATVVDGRDRWLLPGFVNGNVHLLDGIMMMGIGGIEYLSRYEGQFHSVIEEGAQIALRSGMTTVFDTWNALEPVLVARDRIDAGEVAGARIFCAGNIVGMGGPFSADFHPAARRCISTTFANRMDRLFEAGVGHQLSHLPPSEVRPIIRDYLRRGVDMLKVAVSDHLIMTVGWDRTYLTFSERVLRVIAEETRAAGVPLLTHTLGLEALQIAVDLDAEVLIHATLTGQQPIPTELADAIAKKGLGCGMQTVTEAYQTHLETCGDPWAFYGGGEHARNERLLIDAGARILLGTDAGCTAPDVLADLPPGGTDGRPWTLGEDHFLWAQGVVEKGMRPMDAILASTSNVARAYGKIDRIGTIEPGKLADLVVLDADPLADVRNLRRVAAVYKDGVLVDREALPNQPLVTAPAGAAVCGHETVASTRRSGNGPERAEVTAVH